MVSHSVVISAYFEIGMCWCDSSKSFESLFELRPSSSSSQSAECGKPLNRFAFVLESCQVLLRSSSSGSVFHFATVSSV